MGARCWIEAGKNTGSQQTRTSTWRAAFFTATPPVQRRQCSRGEPWHHSNKPTRRIMWARAARVRAYRAHRLAARGLLNDRADRSDPCHRRLVSSIAGGGREKAAVVEPQSALPALLTLCVSSVMDRRQHKRRGAWNRRAREHRDRGGLLVQFPDLVQNVMESGRHDRRPQERVA